MPGEAAALGLWLALRVARFLTPLPGRPTDPSSSACFTSNSLSSLFLRGHTPEWHQHPPPRHPSQKPGGVPDSSLSFTPQIRHQVLLMILSANCSPTPPGSPQCHDCTSVEAAVIFLNSPTGSQQVLLPPSLSLSNLSSCRRQREPFKHRNLAMPLPAYTLWWLFRVQWPQSPPCLGHHLPPSLTFPLLTLDA